MPLHFLPEIPPLSPERRSIIVTAKADHA